MTVALNNTRSFKRMKNKADDFVYSFDSNVKEKEYIALPIGCIASKVTFQKAMKLTIFTGQIFALNPVIGISTNDAFKLRFTYYSGRYVYTVLSIIGQSVLVLFCLLKIFWEKNSTLNSDSAIVFFACNCIQTILFLKMAARWPKLCRHIARIEAVDPTSDETLIWKCNTTCVVLLGLAAVEHILSDLSSVSAALACQPDKHPYEAFLMHNFYWVWVYIPYNTVLALLCKFLAIQCTFTWNYANAFIISLCWYLSARIQQVNDRLSAAKEKAVPSTFWRTLREDYTKATNLVRQVDEIVSGIIFVSFASSLFSICFLILHTLDAGLKPSSLCNVPSENRLLGGYEHPVFFLYSISFLILRSLLLSLMAARVNSTSSDTAFALYDVSADSYNVEVQRFLDQVHSDSIVLSGLQFFGVKRGMILTIAATIITYELVLIQFSGVKTSPK